MTAISGKTTEDRERERRLGYAIVSHLRTYAEDAPIVREMQAIIATASDGVPEALIADHAQDGVDIGAHHEDAHPVFRLIPNPAGGYVLEVQRRVLIEDKNAPEPGGDTSPAATDA